MNCSRSEHKRTGDDINNEHNTTEDHWVRRQQRRHGKKKGGKLNLRPKTVQIRENAHFCEQTFFPCFHSASVVSPITVYTQSPALGPRNARRAGVRGENAFGFLCAACVVCGSSERISSDMDLVR